MISLIANNMFNSYCLNKLPQRTVCRGSMSNNADIFVKSQNSTQKIAFGKATSSVDLAVAREFRKSYREAKAFILEGLRSESPHERGVLIDRKTGKIFGGKIIGEEHSVPLNKHLTEEQLEYVRDPDNELWSLHGHPERKDGKTNPISMADLIALGRSQGVQVMIAFDKKGNTSSWRKTKEFSEDRYDHTIEKIQELYDKEVLTSKKKEELRAESNGLWREVCKMDKAYNRGKRLTEHMRWKYDILMHDLCRINELMHTENLRITRFSSFPKRTDQFHRKHSHELGLKYFCNFEF